MYGARLIENIVQFLASIPIRRAIVHADQLGLKVPLTVHDDVFVLIENSEHGRGKFMELVRFMQRPLDFLPACPIGVEYELLDALDK